MKAQTALQGFYDALEGIRIVRRQAKQTARHLEKLVKWTEQKMSYAADDVKNAESEGLSEPEIAVYNDLLRFWEGRYEFIRKEFETWRKQSLFQIAIAYCVAFETFLLDYLVEQVEAERGKLETFLLGKLRGEIKHTKKLNLSVNFSIPLPIDADIYECLADAFTSFNDLVSSAYPRVLGKDPFGKKLLGDGIVFSADEARKAALRDIHLLFAMRNKIVHRNGKPDESYHQYLKDKVCRPRISPQTLVSEETIFPDPLDVLNSPAISDKYQNKLDEIVASMQSYAEYISQVCSRKELR